MSTPATLATLLAPPPVPAAGRFGTCRGAGCVEKLDPILIDNQDDQTGLHVGCKEPPRVPAPLPPAEQTSLFAAPAGPPPAHPLKGELTEIINWFEANSPRSLQTAIGPSEIGVDCLRRLAYRTLGTGRSNRTMTDPWFAIIGTSVHDWLANAIEFHQTSHGRTGDNKRYLIENRVHLEDGPDGISGSCDLYDTDHERVVDHKIVGNTSLKKYRDHGPSNTYRTQVHLYGYGWERAGRPVREVGIAFYPRSNFLKDMYVWVEPYDRQVAVNALSRLHTTQAVASALGATALPAAQDPNGCIWCPWYRPGRAADATGCPGAG
jgi:hypothetical protein